MYIFFRASVACKTEEICPDWCGSVVGRCPTKRMVTGSIPFKSTCLGCGFSPWSGRLEEATDQCFYLTSTFLSLSFSLSSKKPEEIMYLKSIKM